MSPTLLLSSNSQFCNKERIKRSNPLKVHQKSLFIDNFSQLFNMVVELASSKCKSFGLEKYILKKNAHNHFLNIRCYGQLNTLGGIQSTP